MTTLCFIDTETTGLDPERHEIWEVAMILRTYIEGDVLDQVREAGGDLGKSIERAYGEAEYVWQLSVDLARADLIALNIGHFHERRWDLLPQESPASALSGGKHKFTVPQYDMAFWAKEFAQLTWGAHLVGMVPSFDENRLERLLRRHGACPGWHYQPVDVETLAVGALLGGRSVDRQQIVDLDVERSSDRIAGRGRPSHLGFGRDTSRRDRRVAVGLRGVVALVRDRRVAV